MGNRFGEEVGTFLLLKVLHRLISKDTEESTFTHTHTSGAGTCAAEVAMVVAVTAESTAFAPGGGKTTCTWDFSFAQMLHTWRLFI